MRLYQWLEYISRTNLNRSLFGINIVPMSVIEYTTSDYCRWHNVCEHGKLCDIRQDVVNNTVQHKIIKWENIRLNARDIKIDHWRLITVAMNQCNTITSSSFGEKFVANMEKYSIIKKLATSQMNCDIFVVLRNIIWFY